eukprot:Selendium_serpulae@DN5191_c0_g1_i1.p1
MPVIRCEMKTSPEWQTIELIWEIKDFYQLVKLADNLSTGARQAKAGQDVKKLESPIFSHADGGSWRMEITIDRTNLEGGGGQTGGQPHLLLFRGPSDDETGANLRLFRDFKLQILKDAPGAGDKASIPYGGKPDSENFGMIGVLAWKDTKSPNTVVVKCGINFLMATSSQIVSEDGKPVTKGAVKESLTDEQQKQHGS